MYTTWRDKKVTIKMKYIFKIISITLAVFTLFIVSAKAEINKDLDLTLGITGGVIPQYNGSNENKNIVFPLVIGKYRIDKRNAMLFNPYDGLSYARTPNGNISYGVNVDYRLGRESADNPAKLSGMKDIKQTLEAGPWIKVRSGKLTYMAKLGMDILGSYNGYTAELGVKYAIPINKKWQADVGANVLYGSENYAQTYYGVGATQTNTNRAPYKAKAGFQEIVLSSSLTYFINENTFLRGDIGYKRLLGDAANSPLVSSADQFLWFMSVGYKF